MRHLPLLAVVAAGLALRLVRAALRWDEIALAYAAYQQPWVDAAAAGDLLGVLTTYTGLHPPLYSLLFGLTAHTPAAWLLLSALLSAGAVALVGRTYGTPAAAVLAADPLQLAYAAEVNNYPLLVFVAALCLTGRSMASQAATSETAASASDPGRWSGVVGVALLGVAGVLAGWTHLLGGVFGGLCALTLLRRQPKDAALVLGIMALGCAPIVWRALSLTGQEGTFGQLGLDWAALGHGLWVKVGWWALAAPVALVGFRERPAEAVIFVGSALAILGMVALGVAAVHQQPYWLLLGPPAAALLGAVPAAGWVAALLGLAVWAPGERERVQQVRRDLERPRAIDFVLEEAGPEDALWLLSPALKPDDDKTDTSDVLWRFSPWASAPPWRGDDAGAQRFEYVDYAYGQPRRLGGRVVHSSTDLWPEALGDALDRHRAAGRSVWFVLYDHGPADDYDGMLQRRLAGRSASCRYYGEDVGLGTDMICEVRP